jgi:hypothetical protein
MGRTGSKSRFVLGWAVWQGCCSVVVNSLDYSRFKTPRSHPALFYFTHIGRVGGTVHPPQSLCYGGRAAPPAAGHHRPAPKCGTGILPVSDRSSSTAEMAKNTKPCDKFLFGVPRLRGFQHPVPGLVSIFGLRPFGFSLLSRTSSISRQPVRDKAACRPVHRSPAIQDEVGSFTRPSSLFVLLDRAHSRD